MDTRDWGATDEDVEEGGEEGLGGLVHGVPVGGGVVARACARGRECGRGTRSDGNAELAQGLRAKGRRPAVVRAERAARAVAVGERLLAAEAVERRDRLAQPRVVLRAARRLARAPLRAQRPQRLRRPRPRRPGAPRPTPAR